MERARLAGTHASGWRAGCPLGGELPRQDPLRASGSERIFSDHPSIPRPEQDLKGNSRVPGRPGVVTHPGPPQIRMCSIPASGSSGARIGSPSLSADVMGRWEGESVFPSSVPPASPCPDVPFPPRGPMGRVPRVLGTMRRDDSLPPVPPRFVSFTWAVPCGALRSRHPAEGAPWDGLEGWSPGLLVFPRG